MRISQAEKDGRYCQIAGELSRNPLIHIRKIASKVKLNKKTVAQYLQCMYKQHMLIGPWISVRPHANYEQYVYLLKVPHAVSVCSVLRTFPHVVHCVKTFENWNITVETDKLLDFTRIRKCELVYAGVKGTVYTPPVIYSTRDYDLPYIYKEMEHFTLKKPQITKKSRVLNWTKDEWKLYHAFKSNVRQKPLPVLRKINVQYSTYLEWMKNLRDHCTIHTEFYPGGLTTYTTHYFLFYTGYRDSVKAFFTLLPATPVIIEVGDRLLVIVKVANPHVINETISTLENMQEEAIVGDFKHCMIPASLQG
jgi:hypothetical protein